MSNKSEKKLQSNALRWSLLSLIFNALLALTKWIAGFLGQSSALIADAVESTGDIFSSILVYGGLNYAQKPPDEDHPYGHGRIESVTTFAIVGFLLVAAGIIIFNSIKNMFHPQVVPETYTLYVLVGIIVLKEAFYRIGKYYGKRTHSISLVADAEHHRVDAITSLAAFVGIGIAILFGKEYAAADEWAAIVAACVIIFNAYKLFRPTYKEIMDEQTYPELERRIREHTLQVDGIIGTEKCYIRKLGVNYFVDLHIIVDGDKTVREGHKIAHDLKDHLLDVLPRVKDILIHVEPQEELLKIEKRSENSPADYAG